MIAIKRTGLTGKVYYSIPCECGDEMITYDSPWTHQNAYNCDRGYRHYSEVSDNYITALEEWKWRNEYQGDPFTCPSCDKTKLVKIKEIK